MVIQMLTRTEESHVEIGRSQEGASQVTKATYTLIFYFQI